MKPEPIPMDAIGKILNEVMQRASDAGANSVSMPDEYVTVAHFVAYPGKYNQRIPANFTTHRDAWREALTLARDASTGYRAAYWQHEIDAYDRAFKRLLDNPEHKAEPA